MFNFRKINYSQDIPEVVDLIRKGLNATYTQAFFTWKHLNNPFGKSYGLLAIDGDKIIGLRMFMFWEFYNSKNNKVIKAIRPVDTVVDPSYRGKGLFNKLTLEGLKNCEGKYDLIFNTPNENSLPGYLKMGWKKIPNNFNFQIGILNPFRKGAAIKEIELNKLPSFKKKTPNEEWRTNKKKDYLQWRYEDEKYRLINYKDSFLIYEVKNTGRLREIIIVESYGEEKELQQMLISLGKKLKSFLVYFYGAADQYRFLYTSSRKKAIVTIKDSLITPTRLFFSLGDLEGRL